MHVTETLMGIRYQHDILQDHFILHTKNINSGVCGHDNARPHAVCVSQEFTMPDHMLYVLARSLRCQTTCCMC